MGSLLRNNICKLQVPFKNITNYQFYGIQYYATNRLTVDQNEINHFGKLVDIWWSDLNTLQNLNEVRIPLVLNSSKKYGLVQPEFYDSPTPLKNINLLDVGCGAGLFCEPLAELGGNVTGIDACEDLIECAKLHEVNNSKLKHSEPINYIYDTLENKVETFKNKFDVVISSECIEHVDHPVVHIKSCVDVLKPGGLLFVSTWNRNIFTWLHTIIGCEYIFKIIPKGTHEWKKFLRLKDTCKLIEKNNCEIKEVQGIYLNLTNRKWKFTPKTTYNYGIIGCKRF